MEFDVFHLLVQRPGRVFSQREIYELVDPDSFDSSWTGISSIIYELRHKLNADFTKSCMGKVINFCRRDAIIKPNRGSFRSKAPLF